MEIRIIRTKFTDLSLRRTKMAVDVYSKMVMVSSRSEIVYIGNWKNGKMHGYGTYVGRWNRIFRRLGKMPGMLKWKEKHGIWERQIWELDLCNVGTASLCIDLRIK